MRAFLTSNLMQKPHEPGMIRKLAKSVQTQLKASWQIGNVSQLLLILVNKGSQMLLGLNII